MRQVTTYGNNLLMLAVDPGGESGWLLFTPVEDPDQLTGYGIRPIEWGEERSQMAMCNRIWSLATQAHPSFRKPLDGIVIEGWTNRPGVPDFQPEAVEILGFCRWVMADDPERFSVQQVSHATSFGTDAKIRPYRAERVPPLNVGYGGRGHAVKALQHAVLWTNTRWSPGARP